MTINLNLNLNLSLSAEHNPRALSYSPRRDVSRLRVSEVARNQLGEACEKEAEERETVSPISAWARFGTGVDITCSRLRSKESVRLVSVAAKECDRS